MSNLDNGLQLYLKLDEIRDGNKVVDASGNANDGRIGGNPQLVPDDTFGSCLSFNGQGDYVNLGQKSEFKIATNITLEAWIKVEAKSQKKSAAVISNIHDSGTVESGYGLLLNGQSGIYFGLKTQNASIVYLDSGSDLLTPNKWHHVAGTYDGKEMRLYIDGAEKKSQQINGAPAINYDAPNDLRIARYEDDNETYEFNGKIANVRIYSRALSAEEIGAGYAK